MITCVQGRSAEKQACVYCAKPVEVGQDLFSVERDMNCDEFTKKRGSRSYAAQWQLYE